MIEKSPFHPLQVTANSLFLQDKKIHSKTNFIIHSMHHCCFTYLPTGYLGNRTNRIGRIKRQSFSDTFF